MFQITEYLFCLSDCLSVCLAIYHTFSQCSNHRIIITFSGIITTERSDGPTRRQRSKVKVREVNIQLSRFRTLTPAWIHWWLRNDAQSLKWRRRGAFLLTFKIEPSSSREFRKFGNIWCGVCRFPWNFMEYSIQGHEMLMSSEMEISKFPGTGQY